MKNHQCYNYAYVDPTKPTKIQTGKICFLFQPLYIGKGKNKRCYHGKIALEEGKQLLTNKLLYVALKRLHRRGFDPEILQFNNGTSNEDALLVESAIIELLGRQGLESEGILCNRALGGEVPDTTGLPTVIRGKKMKDILSPERYDEYQAAISKPKSKVAMEKMVQTRKTNGTYTTGVEHPRAKTFIFTSPTQAKFTITGGLKKFCKDQGLSWQMIYANMDKGPIIPSKRISGLSTAASNTAGWSCKKD